MPKFVEVENPFSADITDIYPTGKESSNFYSFYWINFILVSTIGGLMGELWLILDTLQAEDPQDIPLESVKGFIFSNDLF